MAEMTMIQAITDAMRTELNNDDNVLLFGEDVGHYGGVFRATEGLQKEFGKDRVFDTPLAESGIGGLAIGLGVTGFRPIMEIQFVGFLYEVMDGLAGQMSRMHYRTGGFYNSPITVRAPFGGGVKTPELHPDSLEGLMAQTPGIRVVIPSNPYDAKGLLISAIRSDDPVFYLEHMKLYRSLKGEVPEGDYTVDLDKAEIKREGNDMTLVAYGAMVHTALKAAEQLSEENIEAEVIDLRTVSPFDLETIIESVKKTNRTVVIQEAQRQAGIAASISAEIGERAILHLEAPVARVTAPDTVYPFASAEDIWLPDHEDIVNKAKETWHF